MRARNSARERATAAQGDSGVDDAGGWVGRWVTLTVNAILSKVIANCSRLVRITVRFSVYARLLAPGLGHIDRVLRSSPPGEPFDSTRAIQGQFEFADW